MFRNTYKWPPTVVDGIEVSKLIQIYNETVEDAEKERHNLDDVENY